jgi:O-antigen/teichoic acid export membrane protein
MIKSFLKDSIGYLPAQIAPALIGFISIPIITRIFTPQEYGNYILALATISILTTLSGWIPISIIRFYPQYEKEEKTEYFFNTAISFALLTVFIITGLFLLILAVIKNKISANLFYLLFVSAGVFIFVAFFEFFQYWLRVKRKVPWYSGFFIWKSVMSLAIGLGLIFLFKLGIESLLIGIVLSILIILPLLWKKAAGGYSIQIPELKKNLYKQMSSYSMPLVFGNLAAWILSLSDRYILEGFRGSGEVGIYSASYNISEKSVMMITTLFMLAAGPLGVHIWEKEGKEKSAEFASKVTRYYLLICIPAIVGLIVLSRPIVQIMTGDKYLEGYIIFPFIVSGVLFLGLQQRFQSAFVFFKRTKYITFSIIASGLLNLLLNFIFIPVYGYYAAAVTTLVSYVFLLFLMVVLSRRFFVWPFPFTSLIKVLISSVILGAVVFFAGKIVDFSHLFNLFCGIIAGVIVYFAFLYLLGEFSANEKSVIKTFVIPGTK